MSQNGRREFLTSAAAVAAALAACTAPARRAQAQPCGTMYYEQDIVHKVAPYLHDTDFRKQLTYIPCRHYSKYGQFNSAACATILWTL